MDAQKQRYPLTGLLLLCVIFITPLPEDQSKNVCCSSGSYTTGGQFIPNTKAPNLPEEGREIGQDTAEAA